MTLPQGRIFKSSTITSWFDQIALDHNFLRTDVSRVESLVQQEEEQSVDASCSDTDDYHMLSSVRQAENQYGQHDLGIICKLSHGRYLARTFKPSRESAIFVILDPKKDSYIACKFTWNIHFFYQNFGFGGAGGYFLPEPSSIKFRCWCNSSGSFAIIAGPAEHGNPGLGYIKKPSAKLYNNETVSVEEFEIGIPIMEESDNETHTVLGWPAEVLFDPRQGHEEDLTMICSTQSSFCLESWWVEGILLRYNLLKKTITAIFQRESMCTSLLQYLCNGQQVACIEPETYDSADLNERQLQSVRIFNTDTLTPLFIVPGLKAELVFNHSVLTLYSEDESVLAIVLWILKHECQEPFQGQVILCKNPLPKKIQGLKSICRSVILSTNKRTLSLNGLPLPPILIRYLEGQI